MICWNEWELVEYTIALLFVGGSVGGMVAGYILFEMKS